MAKVYYSSRCGICARGPGSPYRIWQGDKITGGCVDHFHTGHLVCPSASCTFHNRPEAKKIRADLKKMRHGSVTEYAKD